jgi:DNA polymerase-1
MSKKLFLLDAMALIYRAYYALIRSPRITTKGRNTSAQFGFTSTLVDLINKEKPTHMAVCFDTWAPTERHTDFAEYKANRQEAPEDLLGSLDDIKRIIRGFNIPVVELDGFEADDVIGTVAWQAADMGYDVYMVTPDKDFGQLLIHPGVYIYKPPYMGNKEEIFDAKRICEKWCIERVEQVVDMLALMGDAVDNIPGIAGVGEKTACKLLKEYGTLEGVLENAENIKGALGEKIRNGREAAIMSKKLARIITDVPVQFHEEDYRLKEWNKPELDEIFTDLEFKALGKRLLGEGFNPFEKKAIVVTSGSQMDLFTADEVVTGVELGELPPAPNEASEELPYGLVADLNIQNTPHNYTVADTAGKIDDAVKELSAATEICFVTETSNPDANDAELVGLSFSYKKGEGIYIPCSPKNNEDAAEIINKLKPLFADETKRWVGQNIKHDMILLRWYGVEVKGEVYDTMLAHYLLEPEGRRNIEFLSAQFLKYEPLEIETLLGKKGKNQMTMADVETEKMKDFSVEDADITLQLKDVFVPLMKKRSVEKVFNEVEIPLVKVLLDMEYEGVKIDVNFLNEYSKELEQELRAAEERVFGCCGERFNLGSPKQLGEILFDKMKLDPKAKKTKSGQYATGEDVLLKLAGEHKVVEDILIYRELSKLKSTYIDALPLIINRKTGRVHTSYNQAVAVTGRLSSVNPNLQNIPVRTDRGREIRKAFIPRDEQHVIVSADYSQIELRIVAAISGDPNMCEAFKQGKDIHTATAAKVYSIDENDVTKEMRYKAKSVNFGIIYGQGAFGLSENLKISRAEAKEIIENYKKQFPNIQQYMDKQMRFAQTNGYVETLLGRKRWLKDINSANFTVRSYAERNAINMPIQGTAADMIKIAMIKIHNEFKQHGFKSKMILQVHDELVFDACKDEVEAIKPIIIECMQSALPLPNDVPASAEIGVGINWLEAH